MATAKAAKRNFYDAGGKFCRAQGRPAQNERQLSSGQKASMNELIAMVRKVGAARLAGLVGAAAGVAMALVIIAARISEPAWGVLYTDIEYAEAKGVIDRLDQDSVPFRTRERSGRMSILAPRAEIARLRLSLAADGEAPRGGVGYEIFDKQEAFGSTTFQQNVNRLRALEGELSRTIATIEGIRGARVHLVLPEKALFAREREQASASIVIDAQREVDRKTVRAIVNLAASAVPGLAPARVTVLDAAGELLASGAADDKLAGAGEKAAETEARLRRTLEDIIGRVVGAENLRVQVAAEMDLTRVTENAALIDPDSQTLLSSVTVEEAADESQPASGRGVTVANALPGAETAADTYSPATSRNRRTEETANYEMSRTTRTAVREEGVLKRLSVAVALNAGAAPRTPEDLARIDQLARSAVGFNAARGDTLSVVEVAFQPAAAPKKPEGLLAAPTIQKDLGRAAEIGALALIGLALVVFVLRPIFAAPKAKSPSSIARAGHEGGVVADISNGGALPALADRRIDLALVEGQVKASSIGKVAEVVKGHTEESAAILKGWIRQTP